jgi:hypothetical protein
LGREVVPITISDPEHWLKKPAGLGIAGVAPKTDWQFSTSFDGWLGIIRLLRTGNKREIKILQKFRPCRSPPISGN